MDKIDKKIKHIWNKVKKQDSGIKGENCLDDKMLSHYIGGVLKNTDKEKVEQHILECNYCLDMILLHKKAIQDEAYEAVPDVPVVWMERAKSLVTGKVADAKAGLFDIVLEFAKETIEVIKNTGNLSISYGAVPVPVRGEKKTLPTNLVTLSRTFSHIQSDLEVEKVGEGKVNMKVMTKDVGSGEPVKGLRISIFNPRREIASHIAENGEVCFEGLRLGEYIVKINRPDKEIGQISLNIKG